MFLFKFFHQSLIITLHQEYKRVIAGSLEKDF